MNLSDTYPNLKVLDLGTNIAGPFAAMILADMGADVTKIERPPGGDDTRALPPQWQGQSTIFLAMNRNKSSMVLDLKKDGDRARLFDLVADTDVLIESFPPGVGQKLGLTHLEFAEHNPALITCSISAFGDGPLGSQIPGYDALAQAVSGLMSFTGNPGEPAVRIAPSALDLTTGMWAAMGIMAAMNRRELTGLGDHIRPSLIDSAFTLMNHQVQAFHATGEPPQKLGSGTPSAAPYGVYSARDGELMIATASEPQFPRLCEALGQPDLAQDERFSTMSDRIENRRVLDRLIANIIVERDRSHWLARLEDARISAGPVNDLSASMSSAVVSERRFFREIDGTPYMRLPIDPDGSSIKKPAPVLDSKRK